MKQACSGCYWNKGTERLANEFGVKESWRVCGYVGYVKEAPRHCEAKIERLHEADHERGYGATATVSE